MSTDAERSADGRPWYHNGLPFTCTGCGDCCTGGPGYVWVNNEEVAAIAAFLGITEEECERQFVTKVGVRKSLMEKPNNYDCVFLDGPTRKCKVYAVRPRQCRTWPFWRSNLKSPQAWEATCSVCPGSGTGRLYSLEEIESQADVIKL
jgi:Fe-S-cluster containining protein